MGAYFYMQQRLCSYERTPLLSASGPPRYVEPPEDWLPTYEERPPRPPSPFTPHPDEPILENAPDLARKIMQRHRSLFWDDPLQHSVLRETGAGIGGLAGMGGLFAAFGTLEPAPLAIVAGIMSPIVGTLAGLACGMYFERQRRAPLGPTLFLEHGVADRCSDAKFVWETLERSGAIRSGDYREHLHDLIDLARVPAHCDALSMRQNRMLRYVLWVAAHAEQVPRGLWEKLEAAKDEDEIASIKALICDAFARLELQAARARG